MAKKALIVKANRKPKFEVRAYTRCTRCGRPRGMDITVVTTATTDEEGRALLRRLGFPFKEA